ncbi:MAG: hypothetical protein AMXMBFR46_14840 [Acidimicrobiia bacterium]
MTTRHRIVDALNRALRRRDVSIQRWSKSTAAARAGFLAREGVDLAIDVGGYHGDYGRKLRLGGYGGPIHSFEPLPDAFARLRAVASGDPGWHCHNVAIGATSGTGRLHVSGNAVSSSLLPMLPAHEAGAPGSANVAEIEVELRTLDDYRFQELAPRCALKIDVQGAERLVLEGASELLPSVRLLEMEMSLVELYAGQDLLVEQIVWLEGCGLRLVWLDRAFQDWSTGDLVQVDGIFRRVD